MLIYPCLLSSTRSSSHIWGQSHALQQLWASWSLNHRHSERWEWNAMFICISLILGFHSIFLETVKLFPLVAHCRSQIVSFWLVLSFSHIDAYFPRSPARTWLRCVRKFRVNPHPGCSFLLSTAPSVARVCLWGWLLDAQPWRHRICFGGFLLVLNRDWPRVGFSDYLLQKENLSKILWNHKEEVKVSEEYKCREDFK